MFYHLKIVVCPSLTDPNNGMINCSLEDEGVPSYEDTCSFTCNTGYELTGSDTIGPVRVMGAGVVIMLLVQVVKLLFTVVTTCV